MEIPKTYTQQLEEAAITEVAFNAEGPKVGIKFRIPVGDHKDDHTLTSDVAANDSFVEAFNAVLPVFMKLLEIPLAKSEKHTLRRVTLGVDDKGDTVLSCHIIRKLSATTQAFNLNSPQFKGVSAPEKLQPIYALCSEARKYLAGDRKQIALDLDVDTKDVARGASTNGTKKKATEKKKAVPAK